MKLHLPVKPYRAVLACFVAGISFATSSFTYATEEDDLLMLLSEMEYPNGSITYTEAQTSALTLTGYKSVVFHVGSGYAGGAINNYNSKIFTLSGNGTVAFSNTGVGSSNYSSGGAIFNGAGGTCALRGNEDVSFSNNWSSASNYTSHSTSSSYGGAISNSGILTLSDNGDVTFSSNRASSYSPDSSYYAVTYGGAIYNTGTFTLSGNANVLFEKNAESENGVYRLRSIYCTSSGKLCLSASANSSITFRDSIYAIGSDTYSIGYVRLNQDYTDNEGVVHKSTGDIIFTGATTEDDLREVKRGIDGTATEILNSRTSEIVGKATLYGGRLIVEDEAILKVGGLSVAEGASVVVKDGTLVLNRGKATITTADNAEKAVMVGASLGASSLAGMDAEHRGSVDGAHIDLAEGVEFSLQHLVLGATTRITDAPATLQLDDVTAELVMGVNASLTGSDMLMAGTMLTAGGRTLTLEENTGVVMLESTLFDSVTLRGDTLVLELAGMTLEMLNGAEYIAVSFTSGGAYASYDSSLAVTLTVDGLHFTEGYTLSSDGGTSTMRYFHAEKAGVTPEPATAALSMLALAGLAARRRRRN